MKKVLIALTLFTGLQIYAAGKDLKNEAIEEIKTLYSSLTASQKSLVLGNVEKLRQIFQIDADEAEFAQKRENNPSKELDDEFFSKYASMAGKEWGKRFVLQGDLNNFLYGKTVVLETWPNGSPKREGRVKENPEAAKVLFKINKLSSASDNPIYTLDSINALILS